MAKNAQSKPTKSLLNFIYLLYQLYQTRPPPINSIATKLVPYITQQKLAPAPRADAAGTDNAVG